MGLRMRAAVLGTVLAGLAAVPAWAATPSVVRTGGPSAPADAKRAVVLSEARLTGRPFTVTSAAGRVVLRGRLRAATGSARPWRHAAIADLSAVRAPGAYRVRAAGLTAARSWIVADGAAGEAVRTVLRSSPSTPTAMNAPPPMRRRTWPTRCCRTGGTPTSPAGGWTRGTR
jgi:hypothetical protein